MCKSLKSNFSSFVNILVYLHTLAYFCLRFRFSSQFRLLANVKQDIVIWRADTANKQSIGNKQTVNFKKKQLKTREHIMANAIIFAIECNCMLCEEKEEVTNLLFLDCGHGFHEKCLRKLNGPCPKCKTKRKSNHGIRVKLEDVEVSKRKKKK